MRFHKITRPKKTMPQPASITDISFRASRASHSNDYPILIEIDEQPLSLAVPHVMDYIGRAICSALYEPLLRIDAQRRMRPAAAARWAISRNGTEYSFLIREDARWSDNSRVEPEHFLNTLCRAAEHPFWSGEMKYIHRVEACPGRILSITLREPVSHFLGLLASVNFSPTLERRPASSSSPQSLSNGPYLLSECEHGKRYLLRPNRYYPGYKFRSPLEFIVQRAPDLSCALFDRGELDITCNTGFFFPHLDERRNDSRLRIHESAIFSQLEFNPESSAPFSDISFRRAMLAAINKKQLVSDLLYGIRPARQFGPKCFPSLAAPLGRYAPLRAKQLLSRSRSPLKPLIIGFHDYYPNKIIVRSIQQQWSEALALKTKLVRFPFDNSLSKEFDLFFALRFPAFDEPYAVLRTYEPTLSWIASRTESARFARLLAEARTAKSRRRARVHREAASMLASLLPAIPLFHMPSHYLIRREIQGFNYPRNTIFNFRDIKWTT